MTSQPEFDWAQAASLLGDDPAGADADMSAIVLELIHSTISRFQELYVMDPRVEAKAITALTHQMRGSLLNFGFTTVGVRMAQLEHGEFRPAEFTRLVEEAYEIFGESVRMLSDRYPSLGIG
jgi:hypothetical protein